MYRKPFGYNLKFRKANSHKMSSSSEDEIEESQHELKIHDKNNVDIITKRWYELYPDNNSMENVIELKPNELTELTHLMKKSFDEESARQIKKNPSDAKWLLTALHKGTSKDKANAGALLVQTNPISNLSALDTLIGQCKVANHRVSDTIDILSELFINSLLPSDRKLMSTQLRGNDWKTLSKNIQLTQRQKDTIMAYWQFENDLKDLYFTYLKNVQNCLLGAQESVKCKCIRAATNLICYSPEKEQMLLSMLVNKLGDPIRKVSGKSLYHLLELADKHPNMCGVITNEVEKLLFRPNITEKSQHYALCYLAQVATYANTDVCTKLVQICFAFFKIYVEKGEVNNHIMQAILLCLRRAIVEAKVDTNAEGNSMIIPKETLDTIYRIIHVADLQISLQALSLLLQIMMVKSGNYDRYYNVLYQKLLDPRLAFIGTKQASLFFYIVHRSIHIDSNIVRCQAMIKRLLQAIMYYPTSKICAALIVIDKLMKSRSELREPAAKVIAQSGEPSKTERLKQLSDGEDDDDDEEKYKDYNSDSEDNEVKEEENKLSKASWVHKNLNTSSKKSTLVGKENIINKYDYKGRNPMYVGAEYSLRTELLILETHFHPTIQMFSSSLLKGRPINYNGNPLSDFSLTHFLERFAFRNPKKITKPGEAEQTPFMLRRFKNEKEYLPKGGRGVKVKELTATNCTEDERYIFDFLEIKRQTLAEKKKDVDENADIIEDVNDDEFENYLKNLGAKDDSTSDYLNEINKEIIGDGKAKKKKRADDDDEEEEVDYFDSDRENDDDIDLENEDDGDGETLNEDSEDDEEFKSDDDPLSDDDGDDSEEALSFSSDDDDDDEPKMKKSKLTSKEFNKKLKSSDDMSKLFASADDFAEILEESAKSDKHGTLGEVQNKDKSSDKQLKWEEKRHNDAPRHKHFHNKQAQPMNYRIKKTQMMSKGKSKFSKFSKGKKSQKFKKSK